MPELPEVETTRRGIQPYVLQKKLERVIIRQPMLRWPIADELPLKITGQKITQLTRRGKYILFGFRNGTLLLHLGMSGSLRLVAKNTQPGKHDHVDFVLSSKILRFTDPRRFGSILWTEQDPMQHKLLNHLGPEPLEETFSTEYLYKKSRHRKTPIKNFIMDSKIVVGIGNIYANEALFLTGIRPTLLAGKVSKTKYQLLIKNIRLVLSQAIQQGGTTLQDFVGGDGNPGYFKQQLKVYGRAGEPCVNCKKPLKEIRLGQRSTVYCSHCQR